MSKRNGNGAHALKLDPHNARKHPDRNKAQIAASLKELGAGRSILVDATDTIIAGNGVYEQAQALGYKVKVIEADGKTLIAVKRPDLKGAKARRMALADNRATETSEWDVDVLADLAANDADALAGLFDERELRDLLGDKMPGGKEETVDAGELVDRAGELQKKWKVCRGDLFEVGRHRILCGDSTNAEDVARLMGGERLRLFVTDPPYGVDYAAKNKYLNAVAFGNRVQTPIENDRLNAVELQALWLAAFKSAFDVAEPGCPYYVNSPQGGDNMMMMMMMRDAGWLLKPHIIWVKNNHVLGRSDYQLKHEPILYGWKEGTHWFYGNRSQFSVWEIDKPQNSDFHPTMKPVALIEQEIRNSSREGDIVGDWFVGSGTTLIACENLKRKGRGIELSPAYVAVCLERLAGMGLTPKRIDDVIGKAKRKTKATA